MGQMEDDIGSKKKWAFTEHYNLFSPSHIHTPTDKHTSYTHTHTHLLLAPSLSPHSLHSSLHAADEPREVGQTQSLGEGLVTRRLLLAHTIYHSVYELWRDTRCRVCPVLGSLVPFLGSRCSVYPAPSTLWRPSASLPVLPFSDDSPVVCSY